ncbi:MAG: hypothetical protein IJO25_00980 [Clostridia bacterium]|nr:hypothetical protein [Clostridia bacterium]
MNEELRMKNEELWSAGLCPASLLNLKNLRRDVTKNVVNLFKNVVSNALLFLNEELRMKNEELWSARRCLAFINE